MNYLKSKSDVRSVFVNEAVEVIRPRHSELDERLSLCPHLLLLAVQICERNCPNGGLDLCLANVASKTYSKTPAERMRFFPS